MYKHLGASEFILIELSAAVNWDWRVGRPVSSSAGDGLFS